MIKKKLFWIFGVLNIHLKKPTTYPNLHIQSRNNTDQKYKTVSIHEDQLQIRKL